MKLNFKLNFFIIISGILIILGFFIFFINKTFIQNNDSLEARASSSANVRGWGWGENTGWMSMNCYNDYDSICRGGVNSGNTCSNDGDCPSGLCRGDGIFNCCCPGGPNGDYCPNTSQDCPLVDENGDTNYSLGNYGVNYNESTGDLEGYAWSDSAGWICFGKTCACSSCTYCDNYATCTNCSGCDTVTTPHGRPIPWACIGKPTWNSTSEFSCSGDTGEEFSDTINLVGHWKMNNAPEEFDNYTHDYTDIEFGNHGLLMPDPMGNSPAKVKGKLGGGLQFDGVDDYIEIEDADELDIIGNESTVNPGLTIEAWIKRNSIDSKQTIIGKWDESLGEKNYILWFNNDNKLHFTVSDGVITGDISQKPICVSGDYHGQSRLCSSNDDCPGEGICKNPLITDIKKWHHVAGKYMAGVKKCKIQVVDSICLGGPNDGDFCIDDNACPQYGACSNSVCVGGPNNGMDCSNNYECPQVGACSNQGTTSRITWGGICSDDDDCSSISLGCFTLRQPELRLFIDGERVFTGAIAGEIPSLLSNQNQKLYIGAKRSGNSLCIGGENNSSDCGSNTDCLDGICSDIDTYFAGKIDNVSIWKSARPADEIWDDAKIEVSGWAHVLSSGEGGWVKLRGRTFGDRVWGSHLIDYETFYIFDGYFTERHNNQNMSETGLLLHLKFDEPEWDPGSTGNVSSTGGTTYGGGTSTDNTSVSTDGIFSSSAEFDGDGDYIDLPDIDFVNNTTGEQSEMTGQIWVSFDDIESRQIIIGQEQGGEFQLEMIGDVSSGTTQDYKFKIALNTTGGSDIILSTISAEEDEWYNLAWTYSGGVLTFFVNGEEQTGNIIADDASGNISDSGINYSLGAFNDGTYSLKGKLDNFAIYNRAKTSLEILKDYNRKNPYSVGWCDYGHDYNDPPLPEEFDTFSLDNSFGCEQVLAQWEPSEWAESYTYWRCDNQEEVDCATCLYTERNVLEGACTEAECSLTDTGLSSNVGYCYKIEAHNETGSTEITDNSPNNPSPQWISTLLCSPVDNLVIDDSVCGQITVSWGMVEGSDGNNVYRSLDTDGCSSLVETGCDLIGHLGEGMDYDIDNDGTNDLVGFWKMNETEWAGQTSEVRDSSGQTNHGTTGCDGDCVLAGPATDAVIQDVVEYAVFDRAGNFNGDDYIDIGTSVGNFSLEDTFTIQSWVNSVLDNSDDVIIGNAWDSPGWHLRITNSNKARFILITDGSNYEFAQSSLLGDGWHHISAVWDGSNPFIYVDGELDTTIGGSGALTTITNDGISYIGNVTYEGDLYFNGMLDNLVIYNKVKSAEEIRVDYEAGNCGSDGCGLNYVCHVLDVDDGNCGKAQGDSSTCCYTDKRIMPHTNYTFVMTATSEAGESAQSSSANMTGQTSCFPAPQMGEQ